MDNKMKVGIMGGTFDPIHHGHLAMAEAVRTKYGLEKILFIPSGNPPHKTHRYITSKSHRYNMSILATISNEFFEVSDVEIQKERLSYTVDTLLELNEKNPNVQYYLIMGADAFCDIETWNRVEKLFELSKVVGATRPGIDMDDFKSNIARIQQKYQTQILHVHVPSLDISSTDIRNRIMDGMTIKYLLPKNVEQYIYKYNLYR